MNTFVFSLIAFLSLTSLATYDASATPMNIKLVKKCASISPVTTTLRKDLSKPSGILVVWVGGVSEDCLLCSMVIQLRTDLSFEEINKVYLQNQTLPINRAGTPINTVRTVKHYHRAPYKKNPTNVTMMPFQSKWGYMTQSGSVLEHQEQDGKMLKPLESDFFISSAFNGGDPIPMHCFPTGPVVNAPPKAPK